MIPRHLPVLRSTHPEQVGSLGLHYSGENTLSHASLSHYVSGVSSESPDVQQVSGLGLCVEIACFLQASASDILKPLF